MKHKVSLVSGVLLLGAFLFQTTAYAAENWKIGRIYYRMVCTACHVKEVEKSIPPSSRTIAEWKAYMDADQHAASGKAAKKVSHYTSKEYRESIKADNKAAAKFIDVPADELFGDVRAFLIYGAKDSDTPASCN